MSSVENHVCSFVFYSPQKSSFFSLSLSLFQLILFRFMAWMGKRERRISIDIGGKAHFDAEHLALWNIVDHVRIPASPPPTTQNRDKCCCFFGCWMSFALDRLTQTRAAGQHSLMDAYSAHLKALGNGNSFLLPTPLLTSLHVGVFIQTTTVKYIGLLCIQKRMRGM